MGEGKAWLDLCKPTSNASKHIANWESQGELLLFWIVCLVYGFDIPQNLVVNVDQTAIHLLLVGNERTYATHGAHDVKVASRGDKRQVTGLLSCFAVGNVLPLQVIFGGKTGRCLPKG